MGFHRPKSIIHPYKEFNFTLIVDLDTALMPSILFCSDNLLNCDMTLSLLVYVCFINVLNSYYNQNYLDKCVFIITFTAFNYENILREAALNLNILLSYFVI